MTTARRPIDGGWRDEVQRDRPALRLKGCHNWKPATAKSRSKLIAT